MTGGGRRVRWKTQRHINRYREIIRVLIKHGFGEFLDRSHLGRLPGRSGRLSGEAAEGKRRTSKWVRIRHVLEELGLTFIKFGQIMSGRPDILPPGLILELEKLQSQVPPFPSDQARRIVEEELGSPPERIFACFQEKPTASGSIAQVHYAELPTGERVVVKIQRPDLEEIVTTDIEIMHLFASLIERALLRGQALNPSAVIDEFGKSLRREIDFTVEAANIRKFAHRFRNNPRLHVPRVYDELSTRRVLVMERVDGIKVSDLRALLTAGADPRAVARSGAEVVVEQIFSHGFFHADPHPGNILVLDRNRVCFLDFGMMGFLLPRHRQILITMMLGLVQRDEARVTRGLLDLSLERAPVNQEALEYEVFELIDRYADQPVKSVNLGELLTRMLRLVVEYHIRMPPGFFLLAKALVTIEGVARRLDPDFEMVNSVEPVVRRMYLRSFSPENLGKELYSVLSAAGGLLRELPADTREIIGKIKTGRIILRLDPADLLPMLRKTDQAANRLSFALVLASLVVGSSIVITAKIPPLWSGVSIIGIAGFLGAGLIGFWLLISMLRGTKIGGL